MVYGSLGAVVIFLFWTYLSSTVLLLGAEVASEYPRVMSGKYDHLWGQSLIMGGWPRPGDIWRKLRARIRRGERVRE